MRILDLFAGVGGERRRAAIEARGAKTGTQGIKGAAERSVVPWELWDEILTAIEAANVEGQRGRDVADSAAP